jgi:hypothetical protein
MCHRSAIAAILLLSSLICPATGSPPATTNVVTPADLSSPAKAFLHITDLVRAEDVDGLAAMFKWEGDDGSVAKAWARVFVAGQRMRVAAVSKFGQQAVDDELRPSAFDRVAVDPPTDEDWKLEGDRAFPRREQRNYLLSLVKVDGQWFAGAGTGPLKPREVREYSDRFNGESDHIERITTALARGKYATTVEMNAELSPVHARVAARDAQKKQAGVGQAVKPPSIANPGDKAPKLTFEVVSTGEIRVRWNAVKDVAHYVVYRGDKADFLLDDRHRIMILNEGDTEYRDDILATATTYYYVITKLEDGGRESVVGTGSASTLANDLPLQPEK